MIGKTQEELSQRKRKKKINTTAHSCPVDLCEEAIACNVELISLVHSALCQQREKTHLSLLSCAWHPFG